jgi:hypothetical protein
MKKTSNTKSRRKRPEDMQPEYDFDYAKAKPNHFAGRISKDRVVVLLDPDVSQVFTTPESVNTVLRAVIAALPESSKETAKHK